MPHAVLIALANVQHDARTLNLARTLADYNWQVTVIGGTRGCAPYEGISYLHWEDPRGRAYKRSLHLKGFVQSNASQIPIAQVICACDVFALPAAHSMQKQCKANLIYDMRELTFALGSLSEKPVKQWLLQEIEKYYVHQCTSIIVSGDLDAELINKRFNLRSYPHVILNTPPFKKPVYSNILREYCAVPLDKKIMVYQGVVHHGRGLEPNFRMLALLPDWHLCVLGEGPALTELQAKSLELGVADRVHWCGVKPYDELHEWTCSADVGLCCIEPISVSYEYALPNKLFEYMMAGVPSLCTDLPAIHAHITKYPVGMLVERSLQPELTAEALRRLMIPATYQAMKDRCADSRKVSYEQQEQKVLEVFQSALQ